ncbi:hypothetical protein OG21DRAFT_1489564 [Imleria badia]|nr:hypothetical protein OG21DRAFT_1489564 [Imleria badia]
MPKDFTDMLRDLSGSSDEDIYGDGDDEGSLSCAEGQAPGDEQQLRRVMLNPAPDANRADQKHLGCPGNRYSSQSIQAASHSLEDRLRSLDVEEQKQNHLRDAEAEAGLDVRSIGDPETTSTHCEYELFARGKWSECE